MKWKDKKPKCTITERREFSAIGTAPNDNPEATQILNTLLEAVNYKGESKDEQMGKGVNKNRKKEQASEERLEGSE